MKINEIHESIHQMNPEEPMNPEVLIQGYGRLNLKQLEDKVSKMFDELAERGRRGDWEGVQYNLNKGLVQEFIKTINVAYDELEQKRRRGGKSSRGIEKR